MEPDDKKKYERRLSKINEIRQKYWGDIRALRNEIILKYRKSNKGPVEIDDPDAKEFLQTVNDMWESGFMEDMRRNYKNEINDPETLKSLKTKWESGSNEGMRRSAPPLIKQGGGLYTSDKLCKVCGLPLSGRQRDYCSEGCRAIARSRKWRRENPEAKLKAELEYLKFCYQEQRKCSNKTK